MYCLWANVARCKVNEQRETEKLTNDGMGKSYPSTRVMCKLIVCYGVPRTEFFDIFFCKLKISANQHACSCIRHAQIFGSFDYNEARLLQISAQSVVGVRIIA